MEIHLSKEDTIWLAAVIDCECSLSLFRHKNSRGRRWQWNTRLSLSNLSLAMIQRVIDLCGGHYALWPKGNKPMYLYALDSNGLRQLLPQVHPYLMVKNRHSELLMEALPLLKERFETRSTIHAERLQEIYDELTKLNGNRKKEFWLKDEKWR